MIDLRGFEAEVQQLAHDLAVGILAAATSALAAAEADARSLALGRLVAPTPAAAATPRRRATPRTKKPTKKPRMPRRGVGKPRRSKVLAATTPLEVDEDDVEVAPAAPKSKRDKFAEIEARVAARR